MSILFDNPPPAIGCGDPGDPIDFSATFGPSQNLQYQSIAGSEGDPTKKTIDFWCKNARPGKVNNIISCVEDSRDYWTVDFDNEGRFRVYLRRNDNTYGLLITASKFMDPSAWSHFHLEIETSHATPSERMRLWSNGVRVSDFYSATDAILSTPFPFRLNGGWYLRIAWNVYSSGYTNFDGQLARFVGISSKIVPVTEFCYFNSDGVWVNKAFGPKGEGADAYGAQGFHLDFADPLDLGKDVSGNGNHFTPNGLTVEDQVTDTPTNNKSSLTPLVNVWGTKPTLSQGNRRATFGSGAYGYALADMPVSSGRWHFQAELVAMSANADTHFGISGASDPSNIYIHLRGSSLYQDILASDGRSIPTAKVLAAGDKVRVIFDLGTREFWVAVNDVFLINEPTESGISLPANMTGFVLPHLGQHSSTAGASLTVDYSNLLTDQASGTRSLTATSRPCPDILNPDEYVTSRVKLAGADVTDVWDMTIGKSLVMTFNLDTGESRVVDTVRGVGFAWETNTANVEIDDEAGGVTAFTKDGFQVGNAAAYQGRRLDVMWRASPKSGMDIIGPIDHVTGTPTTVSQLTGGIVDMCLLIPLDGGDRRWYHRLLPGKYNRLNSSGDPVTDASGFSSTANTLTIGASVPSGRWMAYPFRAVSQFSAFPTYQGAANVNGAFVQTDFLPRLMLTDDIGTGVNGYPVLIDAALNPQNPGDKLIYTNTADGEVTSLWGDFVSNGVKFRAANHPNGSYPYACGLWAQTPGKFARAR